MMKTKFSVKEFAEHLGITKPAARLRLERMVAKGEAKRLEGTSSALDTLTRYKVTRRRMDGI